MPPRYAAVCHTAVCPPGRAGQLPLAHLILYFLYFFTSGSEPNCPPFLCRLRDGRRAALININSGVARSLVALVLPDRQRQGRVQLAMSLLPKATDKGARITASMLTATRSTTASVSCLVMRASGDLRGSGPRTIASTPASPSPRVPPARTPPRHRELRHPRRVCSPPTTNEEGSITPSSSPTTTGKTTPRARGGVTMAPLQLRLEPTEMVLAMDKGAARIRVVSTEQSSLQ
eukprot:scaffold2882_cov100-Isochrysis_galbana.AAC.1